MITTKESSAHRYSSAALTQLWKQFPKRTQRRVVCYCLIFQLLNSDFSVGCEQRGGASISVVHLWDWNASSNDNAMEWRTLMLLWTRTLDVPFCPREICFFSIHLPRTVAFSASSIKQNVIYSGYHLLEHIFSFSLRRFYCISVRWIVYFYASIMLTLFYQFLI